MTDSARSREFDVVVVGGGNAALSAALAARNDGAAVVVLEKAPREQRGGNTRFTGGLFRCTYQSIDDLAPVVGSNDNPDTVRVDPYPREAYLKDIERTTGGRADPRLSEILVDRSYETIRWMAGLGIPWEFNRALGAVALAGVEKAKLARGGALRVKGEGPGLSNGWFSLAEEAGIETRYESEAFHIVRGSRGEVEGVEVRTPDGSYSIGCRALVLGSGGFQSSREMRTAYLGPSWSLVKLRGTRFNTGEMTRAALAAGAESYGHWAGCHATPIDADAPPHGDLRLTDRTNRLSYPYSVMVNLDGQRFVDEGEDFNLYTYAKMGGVILQQREAIAFQLFDAQTIPMLEERYNTGTPVEAETLSALARGIEARYGKLGVRTETLRATVDAYNAAVVDGAFDPNSLDGKHTQGLTPEKTNWALPLSHPPFRAYAVTVGITFTFGGVRVNDEAQVMSQFDRPIRGLFATGEITGGFFYHNYPAGAGLMRGAVFGKLAGEHAARTARGD